MVQVEKFNFNRGQALFGLLSFVGATQADDDLDHDDNGVDEAIPVRDGISSTLITLRKGGEPIDDGDTDADTNQTLDFGFFSPSIPPVLSIGDLVWDDLDANGLRDTGEPGIEGVKLNRKQASAMIAKIPLPLARHIARVFKVRA